MISSKGLRWSGAGISNGRQRLLSGPFTVRNFSVHTINRPSSARPRRGQAFGAVRLSQIQQHRSISLFGWGASSKPSGDEFATSHSNPIAPPTRDVVETWDLKPATLDPTRSVRASHATSDAPDPSLPSPPYTPEPKVLHDLENAIAAPHDSATAPYSAADATDLTDVAEYVGYLKNICGLDYGWGPTATLQNLIEHLHISLGLSWALAIPAMALVCNAIFLYPSFRAADNAARMQMASPILKPLRNEYMEAAKAKDQAKMLKLRGELKAVNKEHGVSMMKVFVPILIQVPLQFGGFRLLRGMSALPVPAFEYERWLWTTDLTMGDPYFILPVLSSAVIYLNLKTAGMAQSADSTIGNLQKILMVVFPFVNLLFMSIQPGAVQLFFFSSSTLVLLRTYAISTPWIRSLVGIVPKPTPAAEKKLPLNIDTRLTRAAEKDAAVVSSNRSFIDKVVDKVKGQGSTFTESFKSVSTQAFGKMEDKTKARMLEKAERYEAEKQLKLEEQREAKNRKTIAGMQISSGGLRRGSRRGGDVISETHGVSGASGARGRGGKRPPGR